MNPAPSPTLCAHGIDTSLRCVECRKAEIVKRMDEINDDRRLFREYVLLASELQKLMLPHRYLSRPCDTTPANATQGEVRE